MIHSGHSEFQTIVSIAAKIVFVIAVVEFSVMMLLQFMDLNLNPVLVACLDVLLLSVVAGSIIFLWVVRPFVRERDRAHAEIRNLALQDELTGLPNRRWLIERIRHMILECERNAYFGALIFIDLDGFKPINDQHGHEAGDAVLRAIAKNLNRALRRIDMPGRIGGDEFAVLAGGLGTNSDGARDRVLLITDKIHAAMQTPIKYDGKIHKLGGSVGVRFITPQEEPVSTLLRDADHAMYQAKSLGSNLTSISGIGVQGYQAAEPTTNAEIDAILIDYERTFGEVAPSPQGVAEARIARACREAMQRGKPLPRAYNWG